MDFQAYLSQPYQGHESFLENIIFPIFGEENYETTWDVELLDSEDLQNQAARTGIRSILRCGTIYTRPTPVDVFDITVSDRVMMDKNRVGVQAIIRRVMDTYSGAFLLIHYLNDTTKWDWRFTFCQLRDKGEFTDNKRYTFLLGPNQACKTAAQNFKKLADLKQIITIKDIVAAFDVEALSKEFFDKYKVHYERFVEYITGKRFVKEGGKFVEKTNHEPHPVLYPAFGSNDKAVRDYVKLLLGRITLLHFVQKKGWLGVKTDASWGSGDERFMFNLFSKASDEQKADFVAEILNPLFFNALDTDRRSNGDVFDSKVFGKIRIPYLNGGLFEKNAGDAIKVQFPADYFGALLTFFSEYNFTIDENDPNEAQVGIDPEMLGKIFENLLEDNKDKGAFYTPKEIVRYMCQESLIAYLVTKTVVDEPRLRAFVLNPDVQVESLNEDEKYSVLGAILNVKICDPAIGSGAFPIGLLNELVRCKEAIYGDEKGRADIKREIIRDNIYGVDIEKGAVDIARLRFWLSLVVDEEEPTPLPNLDYKIMQGNSLLEWYDGVDLSRLVEQNGDDLLLSGSRANELKVDLTRLLKEYFGETNHTQKAALKNAITSTIKEILDIAGVEIPDSVDLAENNQFFLWHTWYNEVFADGGGFDICLGNPPYISAPAQVEHPGLLAQRNAIIKTKKYKSLYQKWDLYIPFMELGFRYLCRPGGVFTMIVPYPLSNQLYAQELRRMMIHEYDTFEIVDLNGTKIFENATVSNCIAFTRNQQSIRQEAVISHIDEHRAIHKSFIQPFSLLEQDNKKCLWNFTQCNTDASIHSEMYSLGDYCYISKGMVLNSDEETAKGEFKKEDLISLIRDERHPRKYIEAKDIVSYGIKKERYLEYGSERCPGKLSRPTFPELYTVPKIMINRLGKLQAYYDEEQILHSDSMFSAVLWCSLRTVSNKSISASISRYCKLTREEMETLSADIDLRYILGILNSKYADVLLTRQRMGDYHIYPEHLRQIPIAPASKEQQQQIIILVNEILSAKKSNLSADTSTQEAEIDRLVYDLYGVPNEERK